MTEEPFDVNKLDEIIVFDGPGDLIEFERTGKFIYLEKPDNKKVIYRFNLQTSEFERINYYKTKDTKITKVNTSNITSWFRDCKLVTKDIHFGRLAVFAKYNRQFERFSSPVRFIEQLGSKIISNIEQWESLGFKVFETEDFFGDFQVKRVYSGPVDNRKAIFMGTVPRNYTSFYVGYLTYGPQDFSKSLLKHLINEYTEINDSLLRKFKDNYNNGEDIIEDKLLRLMENPEYGDCFDYISTNRYHGENDREKNIMMEDRESFNIRMELIKLIKQYNLDLYAIANWIKRQRNVERNDLIYLIETGHYRDYLRCEFELKQGSLSRMVKYPKNFRTEFHKVQEEYSARKESIDRAHFRAKSEEFSDLLYENDEYIIRIPEEPVEIEEEAIVLEHCVRSYIKPMTQGRTLILFLRNKSEPKTPFVTLEVKNGVLKQAYGANDSKPDENALKFLKEWLKEKKLTAGCWPYQLSL